MLRYKKTGICNRVAFLLSYLCIGQQKASYMKKTFKIEVDCANCANLVENEIKKVEGVKDANVVFMTQKMKVEFEDGADTEAVMAEVMKRARKVEPDFCIL